MNYLFTVVLFLLITSPAKANDGAAELPIRVSILDCRTHEKAAKECSETRRCCDIAEKKSE